MRKLTSTNSINQSSLEEKCAMAFTISVIGGRWKLSILGLLNDFGDLRYTELKNQLHGISERMLTLQLKELEKNNIVSRTATPVVPVSVIYSLTEKGRSLAPILDAMTRWGYVYRDNPHKQ